MAKRVFEIIDQMNVGDIDNKTSNVIIGNYLVSANYSKAGTTVSIGVGGNQVFDIESGKKMAILVLVDIEEYNRLKSM